MTSARPRLSYAAPLAVALAVALALAHMTGLDDRIVAALRASDGPVAGNAVTRGPGTRILDDAVARRRVVRSEWEPRAGNAAANARVPTRAELDRYNRHRPRYDTCAEQHMARVTGDFRGTTDEIIRWAAWKWGFEENLVRAVAVKESFWHQAAAGDWDGRQHQSFGLMQVRRNPEGERAPDWNGTFPLSRDSTAFNVDYWGASVRQYYDGCSPWLNEVERGEPYAPGDLWGSVGAWYAGRWRTPAATGYIDDVKGHLERRTWARRSFAD
jgi:hypothetical protein